MTMSKAINTAGLLFLTLWLVGPVVPAQAQQHASTPVAQADTVALPPALDRVLRDYEAGWRARNAALLSSLFTPDGFILRPGHPRVQGREAIAEAYGNSGGPLHLHAFAYAVEDSVGYIIGGYRSSLERPDSGKYILTLRKMADGQWYISADMDNQN